MNILFSPFLGKIKDVKEHQITMAFAQENCSTPKCVTTLNLAIGGFIDATTTGLDGSLQLKRRLTSEPSTLTCTQLVKRSEVINIFSELLNGKTDTLNQFEWKKVEYNFGKKPYLFIVIFLFVLFNIILATSAYQLTKKQNALKPSAPQKTNTPDAQFEIEQKDGEWVIRNKKNGDTQPLDIEQPIKNQLP